MNWVSLILALLKLATSLTSWLRQREALEAGRDKEIARASLAVLEATAAGNELRRRIEAMEDPEAEDLWNRMLSERSE